MAKSHICYLLLLVVSVLLLSTFSDAQAEGPAKGPVVPAEGPVVPTEGPVVGGGNNLRPEECQPKCDYRCSATKHRKDYCMEFCLKCCAKCLCVPPGTYGHKEACPCYNDLKTKEGKPKCP